MDWIEDMKLIEAKDEGRDVVKKRYGNWSEGGTEGVYDNYESSMDEGKKERYGRSNVQDKIY